MRCQKLRLAQGRGRSGNEDGPIHDLSDFHFADGRPAPITPKQELWRKKREMEKQRITFLAKEMIELHQKWEAVEKELGEPLIQLPRSKKIKKKQRRRRIHMPRKAVAREEEQRRDRILDVKYALERIEQEMKQKKENEKKESHEAKQNPSEPSTNSKT